MKRAFFLGIALVLLLAATVACNNPVQSTADNGTGVTKGSGTIQYWYDEPTYKSAGLSALQAAVTRFNSVWGKSYTVSTVYKLWSHGSSFDNLASATDNLDNNYNSSYKALAGSCFWVNDYSYLGVTNSSYNTFSFAVKNNNGTDLSATVMKAICLHELTHCLTYCGNYRCYYGNTYKYCVMSTAGVQAGCTNYCTQCKAAIVAK